MRKLFNKMFKNKKLSLIIPITIASFMYLLFVFFGTADDKTKMIIITPVISAFWFFGVCFIFFIQVKNPSCPELFLNIFEISAIIFFGIYTLIGIVSFLFSGFQNFSYGLCLGPTTYSAVSWAHNKRTK